MAAIAIDWASSDVSDGQLTVAFTEKPSKDWTERLQAVIERLAPRGSGWGDIKIGKKKLRIDAVQPGSEDDLRHFLDSAILQANASSDEDEDEDTPADARSERDQALTDAFRAFADS
jgi:hypothetical protein